MSDNTVILEVKELHKSFDGHEVLKGISTTIKKGDVLAVARSGRNDLEPPARALAPLIDEVLAMLEEGPSPILSRMSGSGATCFALYASEGERSAAAERMRATHPEWWCLETALV